MVKLLVIISILLTGCAPSLRSTIPEPILLSSIQKTESLPKTSFSIRIGEFVDKRSSEELIKTPNKDVFVRGIIGDSIENGFKRIFPYVGGVVVGKSSATIDGEIEKWSGSLRINFPISEFKTNSVLLVNIKDLNGKIIFQKRYYGSDKITGTMVSRDDIYQSISKTMEDIILKVVADPDLIFKLRSSIYTSL